MRHEEENTYAANTLAILKERKSCRNYTGAQIEEKQLEAILQAGNGAPVGMNRVNDIRILVIQNSYILNELEQITQKFYVKMGMKRSGIYGAPTLIIVTVKKSEGAFQKGQYCSAACILENMVIAATEMRLGNVFLTGFATALNEEVALLVKLGIKEDYEVVGGIAIGDTEEEGIERELSNLRILVERRV